MLTFLVYLWLKLDSVLNGILVVTVLYAIAIACYGFLCAIEADVCEHDQKSKIGLKLTKRTSASD